MYAENQFLIIKYQYFNSLNGPNSVIKNTLERTHDNLFKVTYVPVEVGFVNISIKWNGKDIVNSPFKAAVTNPG